MAHRCGRLRWTCTSSARSHCKSATSSTDLEQSALGGSQHAIAGPMPRLPQVTKALLPPSLRSTAQPSSILIHPAQPRFTPVHVDRPRAETVEPTCAGDLVEDHTVAKV